MFMQLAIAKNNIIKLQEENQQLRSENSLILLKAQQHLEVHSHTRKCSCKIFAAKTEFKTVDVNPKNSSSSDHKLRELMHDNADMLFSLGNPRRCLSGKRHIQTVSSGFGWDVQRGSETVEGGVSAQTGHTLAAYVWKKYLPYVLTV